MVGMVEARMVHLVRIVVVVQGNGRRVGGRCSQREVTSSSSLPVAAWTVRCERMGCVDGKRLLTRLLWLLTASMSRTRFGVMIVMVGVHGCKGRVCVWAGGLADG